MFFIQKNDCAFAQFIFLLYFCAKKQPCGRTQRLLRQMRLHTKTQISLTLWQKK